MKKTLIVTPCGESLRVLNAMFEKYNPNCIICVGATEIERVGAGEFDIVKLRVKSDECEPITILKDIRLKVFETRSDKITDDIVDIANTILDTLNRIESYHICVCVCGGRISDNLICTWVSKSIPLKKKVDIVAYDAGTLQSVPRFIRRKRSDGLWENDNIDSVIQHFLKQEHGNKHYYSLESVHFNDGRRLLAFRRSEIAWIDSKGNLFFPDIHKNAQFKMFLKVREAADNLNIPHNKARSNHATVD